MSENINQLYVDARAGNAEAQYRLGILYTDGNGVELDMNKAVFWFEKAAVQNHVEAIFELSGMYMHLFKIHRDMFYYKCGAFLFKKAAKLGHPAAAANLELIAELEANTEKLSADGLQKRKLEEDVLHILFDDSTESRANINNSELFSTLMVAVDIAKTLGIVKFKLRQLEDEAMRILLASPESPTNTHNPTPALKPDVHTDHPSIPTNNHPVHEEPIKSTALTAILYFGGIFMGIISLLVGGFSWGILSCLIAILVLSCLASTALHSANSGQSTYSNFNALSAVSIVLAIITLISSIVHIFSTTGK